MNRSQLRADTAPSPDYTALYRDLREPAWVIDPQTSRFLDANGEAVGQLGFSMDEIRSLAVTDINRAVPDDTVWRSLTGGMKAGESVVYTAQLRCKQGDLVDVEITLSCQAINGQKVFVAVTRSQAGNHG
jgi:PAS domain S-box-containing protein